MRDESQRLGAHSEPHVMTPSGKIRWRWAADARTRSHSGKVMLGIVLPKVIALGVRIAGMRKADAQHRLHRGAIGERGLTQFAPVLVLTAIDHVVDRGKGKFSMIQVPMFHMSSSNDTHRRPHPKPPVKRRDGASCIGHKRICCSSGVYVDSDIMTNGTEPAFSLLNRGIGGSWHKASAEHLSGCLDDMTLTLATVPILTCSETRSSS